MSVIKFEQIGKTALITLNDPKFRNAFGEQMATELFEALMKIEDDESIRCMVLTAEGSSFCSGGKFGESDRPRTDSSGIYFLRKYAMPVMFAMKNLRVPIITAINGPAIGFGVGFSLMNDLSYAAKSAYFRLAFSKIGISIDGGSTWVLPRLIGAKRTAELAMLDHKLPATEAMSWGMVNKVFDDDRLLDESLKSAEKLANGPVALSYMRDALWNTWQNSFESQIDLEIKQMHKANKSEDAKEGGAAFMEKRSPNFLGK